MNIFEEVKAAVDVRSAAGHLGLAVRNGMCSCPLHTDRTPSMKLYDDHFHCFSCGEHGDVIDLAQIIYGTSAYEAAKILASDFGIAVNNSRPVLKRCTQPNITAEDEKTAYRLIDSYVHLLERYLYEYAPRSPDDYVSVLFVQALHEIELFRYYRSLFYEQEYSERIAFIAEHGGMLLRIERALNRSMAA